MASRWSRRNVFTASRAFHRSALAMVIDALASASDVCIRADYVRFTPKSGHSEAHAGRPGRRLGDAVVRAEHPGSAGSG